MNNLDPLQSCKSYIECQFRGTANQVEELSCPFVTIFRQAGAGGITIGRLLSDYLPERLQEYMNEEKISEINDILEELFQLHPAKWTLVRKTSKTIFHLTKLGYIILVGRGSAVLKVLKRALQNNFFHESCYGCENWRGCWPNVERCRF